MWANYDYSNQPIVKVIFEKSIKDEEDFNQFLKEWVTLYDNKRISFLYLIQEM